MHHAPPEGHDGHRHQQEPPDDERGRRPLGQVAAGDPSVVLHDSRVSRGLLRHWASVGIQPDRPPGAAGPLDGSGTFSTAGYLR